MTTTSRDEIRAEIREMTNLCGACGACGSVGERMHIHVADDGVPYEAGDCPFAGRAYEANACSGDDLCGDCAPADA